MFLNETSMLPLNPACSLTQTDESCGQNMAADESWLLDMSESTTCERSQCLCSGNDGTSSQILSRLLPFTGFFFLYGSQKHWFIAIRRTSTLCQGPYKPVLTCAGFLLTGRGSMDLHPPFAVRTCRKKTLSLQCHEWTSTYPTVNDLSCKVFSTCTGITSNVGSCFTNILSPAYQWIPRNKKDFLCLLEFFKTPNSGQFFHLAILSSSFFSSHFCTTFWKAWWYLQPVSAPAVLLGVCGSAWLGRASCAGPSHLAQSDLAPGRLVFLTQGKSMSAFITTSVGMCVRSPFESVHMPSAAPGSLPLHRFKHTKIYWFKKKKRLCMLIVLGDKCRDFVSFSSFPKHFMEAGWGGKSWVKVSHCVF